MNKYYWTPTSERYPPKNSYTKKFWLTVITDDKHIETVIGEWCIWSKLGSGEEYNAFNCWKDVLINGNIFRMSQPIPMENVLAWMPAPNHYSPTKENKSNKE